MSIRDAIGNTILELAKNDPNIVVVTADLARSLRVDKLKKIDSSRFIEVGVAEQNMAGVGAGLALYGKTPFILSFASFNPGLNLSMIRTIAYSNLNVKIIGGHAGLSNAGDGATHQALEDIAIIRSMPNMTVLSPADDVQAKWVIEQAVKIKGPVYIRSTRLETPRVEHDQEFKLGFPELMPIKNSPAHNSNSLDNVAGETLKINHHKIDVLIVVTGSILTTAIQVAKELDQRGIITQVVNLHTLKPIDTNTISKLFIQTQKLVVSIEDHQVVAGLGGLLAEIASEIKQPHPPLLRIGVNDQFGQSARSAEKLYAHYGLDKTGILKSIQTKLVELNSKL